MDINYIDIPILLKDEYVKKIMLYDLDNSNHNVSIATLRNNANLFLLELSNNRVCNERTNIKKLVDFKHKNVLKILYLMTKPEKTFYLCFEYSDIPLSTYIANARPNLVCRLSLLKQCTELIIYFKNTNTKLDRLDSNYIFIESIESPNLKVLYSGNIK
jgi:hypothetical protein